MAEPVAHSGATPAHTAEPLVALEGVGKRYAHRVAIITSEGQLLVGDKSQLMKPKVLMKAYQES